MLSGTTLWGDTPGARKLLTRWLEINEGADIGGGQRNLWQAWNELQGELTTYRMPGRYCRVFDKPWAYPESEPVVIEHLIASREFRPGAVPAGKAPRRQRIQELERLACNPL